MAGLIHLVAPSALLLPVRVLDDECRGTAFALARGIVAAVDAGANVINASLGARERSQALSEAIAYAASRGVLVVAAAGNIPAGESDRGREHEEAGEDDDLQFPASDPGAIAVAAVNFAYVATPTTACGPKVALSAPGIDVLAPWRSGYAWLSGTSNSAALVSGAAAVGLHHHPALGRSALIAYLRATAIPIDLWNPERQGLLGAGVPDIARLAGLPPASPPLPRKPPRPERKGPRPRGRPGAPQPRK